ncbi:HlyD family efflux transporter periplasmic adaptor subunit [Glaciimonas sp. Gout2]|uniref:HlyD family secretion protein n=1 Tax=unclassified Glaciimonas TaxID=2644401 RepID=UPI002B227FD4|nr:MULTISPECIES: HlyD family efflux transporter periplasmic adaptor subunit [unclassified Glaciimonas]MEB0010695.1 HlyD family efflux transporter periplasmic adaptor subunit [Glaciimonas sp. Cout2]MEB0082169.1 HlyD family efflux transporter periplasmic adaptor subunit [Glaciimonas sp. Gout2]
MPLFREQAIAAQQANYLNGIILIRPLSMSVLTGCAFILALLLGAFLTWGSYTRHSTVTGQLIPTSGFIKVYAMQPGIVVEKRVTEDSNVIAGEVLYVLSGERDSSSGGPTQAAISAAVIQRQVSLQSELQAMRSLQQQERGALIIKITGTDAQRQNLAGQIDGQRARVALAQLTEARYHGLLKQDFISQEQWQQKQEELLDQRNRQQSLERDRISVVIELAAQRNALGALSLQQQNQSAQIERSLSNASQELSESEARRRLVVKAPQAGRVTAVLAEMGQTIDPTHPLLSIVPSGVSLRAELYAPSRSIGFVRVGDQVSLRYSAYPYQKFGHQRGTVETVALTTLSGSELGGTASGAKEPLYRITVALQNQSVRAYGSPQPLLAGMSLEADIAQEKRHLYEWVLEPLYTLTGKR